MAGGDDDSGVWCMVCGYCLRGLAVGSSVCPECGRPLSEVAVRYRRSTIRARLAVVGAVLVIPATAVAALVLLFLAPCIQIGSGYRYVGDWSHSLTSADASRGQWYCAMVGAGARRTVLGYFLAWPIRIEQKTIEVETRYNSGLGLDRVGFLQIQVDPEDLQYRLVDTQNDATIRTGPFDFWVVHDLLTRDISPSVSPERAKPIVDAVRAVAGGGLLADHPYAFHRNTINPVKTTWLTWVMTACVAIGSWLAMVRFARWIVLHRMRVASMDDRFGHFVKEEETFRRSGATETVTD